VVDHAVVRDGVEPGAELGARLVAGARLDRPHPHVLEDLLGLGRSLDRAQHEAEEGALVAEIEGVERGCISAGISEHQ
jgi:hypothetical protein